MHGQPRHSHLLHSPHQLLSQEPLRAARSGRVGTHFRLRHMLPIHSPLLKQSQLLALPPLSDMLKFSGLLHVHQVTVTITRIHTQESSFWLGSCSLLHDSPSTNRPLAQLLYVHWTPWQTLERRQPFQQWHSVPPPNLRGKATLCQSPSCTGHWPGFDHDALPTLRHRQLWGQTPSAGQLRSELFLCADRRTLHITKRIGGSSVLHHDMSQDIHHSRWSLTNPTSLRGCVGQQAAGV